MQNRNRPSAPRYLISPRYLAGPDPAAVTTADDVLLAAGWKATREPCHTDYRDPSGQRHARHLHSRAVHPGKPLMAWEFTASAYSAARVTWTAWFSHDTPPEITAAFAAAVADDTPGPTPEDGPRYLLLSQSAHKATEALATAGWIRDIGRQDDSWYTPNEQAVVITATVPSTTGKGGANWLCAARRAADAMVLWVAVASPATPTHLMAALCRALTDPTPVPRHSLPDPEVGALTVTRCP
ncbi:DUF317 domain-containing protein [Streptomyces violaceusniger]|uniref:DUF317 domain-containing protein n=1 Tax=Streptomyces violaceusniger TaxID=68280 RepID=UPI000997B755|nr:DUF317 domain-containing protein [Streptomyces hygroscopicus]AQW48494.1 hypothetical protein SHXM_01957 [Streptomyces hygroscopicus]